MKSWAYITQAAQTALSAQQLQTRLGFWRFFGLSIAAPLALVALVTAVLYLIQAIGPFATIALPPLWLFLVTRAFYHRLSNAGHWLGFAFLPLAGLVIFLGLYAHDFYVNGSLFSGFGNTPTPANWKGGILLWLCVLAPLPITLFLCNSPDVPTKDMTNDRTPHN